MGINTTNGLCGCGCGNPAPIATRTQRAYGHVKGEPVRFIKGHCGKITLRKPWVQELARQAARSPERNKKLSEALKARNARGPNSPSWKGGRKVKRGYVFIWKPEHPNSDQQGYVLEHRFVMSEQLGRPLEHGEEVHHKNGRRADNRIDNLELRILPHGRGTTHCPHCGEPLFSLSK